jgi:hypothetical protein
LVVQGRLVTQGYRAAVRERLGERHLELYLKQMGHQRQHKRLSRLLMQLGKAGKEVSLSWVVKVAKFMWGWQPTNFKLQQRGDKEQATCQLEGCSGVECGWHVAAECQHREMVECRRPVMEQMRGRLEKLQKLPRDLRWAVAQLWGLDEGGVMQRWEEMDWAREGGAWEERASALRGASDSRVALMGRLCMEKPSDFRATGWVSTDWEEVLEEMGVGRELVQQLMQVMRKGVEELWVQTWEVRNRLTHAEEEAAAQDKRKELLGELREGYRELGEQVPTRWGERSRVRELQGAVRKVHGLVMRKERERRSAGQRSMEEMYGVSRRIKKVREQKAATTEAGSSSRGAVQLPIRQLLATKATELVAPDVWNSSGWGRAKRKRGQGEGNKRRRACCPLSGAEVGSRRKRAGGAGVAEAGCLRQLRLAVVNSEEAASRSQSPVENVLSCKVVDRSRLSSDMTINKFQRIGVDGVT